MRIAGLLQGVAALCIVAALSMAYFDMVHLPQKKMLQEQDAALQSMAEKLEVMKSGGGGVTRASVGELRGRIGALEEAFRGVSPRVASKIKAASKETAKLEEAPKVAAGQPPPFEPSLKRESQQDSSPERSVAAAVLDSAKADIVRWRSDYACGTARLPDGRPAECDPQSQYPCCSSSGWCGLSQSHCNCDGCRDFREQPEDLSQKYGTYDERTPKAIAIVVPFRDRGMHLKGFRQKITNLIEHWNKIGVKHQWVVFIVEQFDDTLFNRGYLFNVGFQLAQQYAKNIARDFDCVVMHDIDILPTPDVDYGWCMWPNQLCGEIDCWGDSVPYQTNVGGVVSLSPAHWLRINGFSNQYEGWGGEDDDLYERLRQNNLLKGGCHKWCQKRPAEAMVYRPPLGKGRFTCLHDGDHTPRKRAVNDADMWARLRDMKGNSKRWKNDGISDVPVHEAGSASFSPACEQPCAAPEDPVMRTRHFTEVWARTSSRLIPKVKRIQIAFEGCNGTTDNKDVKDMHLREIPGGIEQLKDQITKLSTSASASCRPSSEWLQSPHVALVDVNKGQSILVGIGAKVVPADSSLPPVKQTEKLRFSKGSGSVDDADAEYLVQGQRLSAWIRKLPKEHPGLMIVPMESSAAWRERLVQSKRYWPQTMPACISVAAMDGQKKFRLTPGTTWCGDGGWTHDIHFPILRSGGSLPADKVVPICVSYNNKHYTYRFENSETGCIGLHEKSGTRWQHDYTLHASADSQGSPMCVGVMHAGEKTRWMIGPGETCNLQGFQHSFAFAAINRAYKSPFLKLCLLKSPGHGKRLEFDQECQRILETSENWKRSTDVWLLAEPQSADDAILCLATGIYHKEKKDGSRSSTGQKVWRAFQGQDACALEGTREEGPPEVSWTIDTKKVAYIPARGSARLCLCKDNGHETKEGKGKSGKGKKDHSPLYQWKSRDCDKDEHVSVFCIRTLMEMDFLRYSYLFDEMP
eukprot:TRINITY_DN36400_c0_g1_i1.p1 TRINITY_DN36400_c0_g1~~TRINITY_DN36400_c0_g1_i1.p1  ORF type:complete len:975 (-),score=197.42 TRINITY_DN36400_c0_g1_i1:1004-3928(-)